MEMKWSFALGLYFEKNLQKMILQWRCCVVEGWKNEETKISPPIRVYYELAEAIAFL